MSWKRGTFPAVKRILRIFVLALGAIHFIDFPSDKLRETISISKYRVK
jgi:hypothetical protein